MDNCPYMYFERDGNASIAMCSLHPNELWGVDERTCMYCTEADPKWREWKLSLLDQKRESGT